MDSMADLMKKLGWIAWCLTVIGWFLSPIISLLVNKISVYLGFDTARKLKELENDIIRKLKQTLGAVEEQTVLRAAEVNPSQSDLKILDRMKKDIKSALYEAEDILDLLDYRRIDKGIFLGDDGSRRWVEHKLDAGCAWIAHYKGTFLGRWIHVTLAVVMKSAQSMIQQGQLVIQGWRHFDLFSICRAIKIVILPRSGLPLLPVCINSTGRPPSLQSRGSELVPADPAHRPAQEMVDAEGIVEEAQVEEGEAEEDREKSEEIEEEGCEGGQEGEISEEEIEEGSTDGEQVGETLSEEEIEEDDEEGKGEPTSSSILRYCARSMLTWFVKAYFYRDWSYGIVGIQIDKKDATAVESLVPITQRISLKNQIDRIEVILNTSKKSDLLNDENSSSGTTKDNDKESSRFTVKNRTNETGIGEHKSVPKGICSQEKLSDRNPNCKSHDVVCVLMTNRFRLLWAVVFLLPWFHH